MAFSSSWELEDDDFDDDGEQDALSAEDFETLRRACTLSGADPSGGNYESDAAADCGREEGGGNGFFSFSDEEEEDDDLCLLRRLRERFPDPTGTGSQARSGLRLPGVTESLAVSFPGPCERDDDDDDDFETLRAVQRRFQESAGRDGAAVTVPGGGDDPLSCCHQSSMTTSARLLLDALRKNRACQRFIRKKLIEVQARVEQNKAMVERVGCLMAFQDSCNKKAARAFSRGIDPRIRLVSPPKPRRKPPSGAKEVPVGHLGPPEITRRKRTEGEEQLLVSPLQKKNLPWSEKEKESLTKGIRMQYMVASMESMMKVGSVMEEPFPADDPNQGISEPSPAEIRSFLPMVNWDYLASAYLPGRTGGQCRTMWLNCEDPLINHGPWTKPEEKRLLQAVIDAGLHDWAGVAARLGTRRTPSQCLARFQRSLNPHFLNSEWTGEEDALLRAAVGALGEGDWQAVAACMGGRTGTQCSERWRKTLQPGRERVGRWDVGEDKRLKVAVALFGARRWNKIAGFVPGRTQAQCRERWVNCLSPCLRLEPWSEEEDAMLRAAVEEHGLCWAKVAECVLPRTDNQCWRRWKVLFPDELCSMRAVRRVRRAAQVRNFVGRQKERPSIGPADFCLASDVCSADGGEVRTEKRRRGRRPRDQRGRGPRDGASRPCGSSRKRRAEAGAPEGDATADWAKQQHGNGVCCEDRRVAEHPECMGVCESVVF